jgi:membrane-associated phospholipid phosphatase
LTGIGGLTLIRLPALGPSAALLLAVLAALAAAGVMAAHRARGSAGFRVLHDFSPIVVVLAVFWLLGVVIAAAKPTLWDPYFAALDRRAFGALPEHWRALLGRPAWFVDLNALFYTSYYVVPVIIAIALYRRDRDTFHRMMFTATLTFYGAYIGYVLCPTLGPRLPAGVDGLGGGGFTRWLENFLAVVETTRTDAFPSGHVAVALVCLWYARRAPAPLRWAVAPLVVGIAFSTVYLHYHYVVDVVVGTGLAVVCVWLGPRLEALMDPRRAAGAGAMEKERRRGPDAAAA